MGVVVWGPLGQGMLTGRVRRGQDTDVRRAKIFTAFSDDRRLTVEQLVPLAEEGDCANQQDGARPGALNIRSGKTVYQRQQNFMCLVHDSGVLLSAVGLKEPLCKADRGSPVDLQEWIASFRPP